MIKALRNRFRRIKWRHWRAKHKLPPEDWWDFKYTLADIIRQGLEGLLYEGVCDWDSEYHKKEKQDLEFILKWATEFPYYESCIIAQDSEDWAILKKKFGDDVLVITKEQWEQWEKRQQKAFRLLGKNIHTLWD